MPHFELGPATKGSRTDIKQLDENAPYSWIKTPRWRGNMMEVGPLARTLIAYQLKQPDIVARVDDLCARIGAPVTSLQSTMGRILTRAQEAHWAADTMQVFFDKLITNLKNGDSTAVFTNKWDPDTWPQEARGVGFTEAPRGALGHWTVIKTKRWTSTSVSSRPHGTPHRAATAASSARMRPPCSARRWMCPSSRWKSCVRSTASIPALPVRRTSWGRTAANC